MEERRKIIIPTGANPDESSSQQFFNTQATRAAQPVVPLPEAAVSAPLAAAAVTPAMAQQPVKANGSRRSLLLAFLILIGVGIGVAAGVVISGSKSAETEAAPSLAIRPYEGKSPSVLPWTHTPDEPIVEEETTAQATVPDEVIQQTPDKAPDKPPVRVADNDDRETKSERKAERQEERRERREQRQEDREEQKHERQRQRRANRGNNDDDLPQDPLKRSRDEINRVREIFEGPPRK